MLILMYIRSPFGVVLKNFYSFSFITPIQLQSATNKQVPFLICHFCGFRCMWFSLYYFIYAYNYHLIMYIVHIIKAW